MILRTRIAALTLSAAGLVGLVAHEGWSDHAVIPVKGDVPTIGFGTTEGVKMGDRITPPVALAKALKDINKFEGAVKKCVTADLTQGEYDVYIDFAYNVGQGNFCSSTMVKMLNAHDYEGACRQFPRWFKGPGGRDCRDRTNNCYGLVDRRSESMSKCLAAGQ